MLRRRDFLRALAAAPLAAACRSPSRSDGRVTVDLWFSYGGKNREVLLDLVKRFNAAQREVHVHAVFQGDYFEALAKLRTALAAGAAPALSHVVGEVVPYLARAGVLDALDDDPVLRTAPFARALGQAGAFAEGASRPLVAIPFNRSTPIMYVNQRMLEREGVRVPTTWDELRDAARALVRRDPRDAAVTTRWGFEVPISWWFWVAMVGQAGGTVVGPDGAPTLGGEAGEKALRYWQTLVHEDRVMRPPPGRDFNAWQATNQDFLAERVAITWNSTAFLRNLEESSRFPIACHPLPRDVRAAVPTGGTFFIVLKDAPAEERRAARAFLRFMSEPEQTIDWATRTGYLPVTDAAIERLRASGFYASHPNDAVSVRQLADVDPWPWAPDLFFIERDVVEPRLEDAVLTRRDARVALDEARAAARSDVR